MKSVVLRKPTSRQPQLKFRACEDCEKPLPCAGSIRTVMLRRRLATLARLNDAGVVSCCDQLKEPLAAVAPSIALSGAAKVNVEER